MRRFEDETFINILNRMLDNIDDDIDKREGSVAYDMLAPKATELEQAYIQLDNVLNFGFADTTYGEFLDKKVSEAGLTRIPATNSYGEVTLTNESEDEIIDVPAGTVIFTSTDIRFSTVTDVSIEPLGTVNVQVKSEDTGNATNVAANQLVNIELADIICTNESPTTGGAPEESDESLYERYIAKINSPGVSGSKNQYKQWAMSIEGVGNARIIPTWNGEGTVKVILIDANKDIVSQVVIDNVANYIESVRPIGATVTVTTAIEKPISFSATLVLNEGFTLEMIEPVLNESIALYLKSITFSEEEHEVRYSKIGTILVSTDGIVDYSDLLINGGTSNITINDDEIPKVGEVSFS